MKNYQLKQGRVRQSENGLTLIELAVALIVVGLLIISFIKLYDVQRGARLQQLQNYKIFTIADGLQRYWSEHGHYPCPARRDLSMTDPNFAASSAVTVSPASPVPVDRDGDGNNDLICNNPDIVTGGSWQGISIAAGLFPDPNTLLPSRVRIGTIPYKEVGIGKEDIIDVYGNLFTYAVVETQATENLYEEYNPSDPLTDYRMILLNDVDLTNCDAVTGVCTTATDNPRSIDLVFFSHGENARGAYNASVASITPQIACNGVVTNGDIENCNEDAVFVTSEYAARSAASTGVTDDTLSSDLAAWTYIWDIALTEPDSIYNRADGNMAVGLRNGDQKVHILGNLKVESAVGSDLNDSGKVQTNDVCGETLGPATTDCFDPANIAGLDADPDRFQCPDGFIMHGMGNGDVECRSILFNATAACVNNLEYATGFTFDPATGVVTLTCATYTTP